MLNCAFVRCVHAPSSCSVSVLTVVCLGVGLDPELSFLVTDGLCLFSFSDAHSVGLPALFSAGFQCLSLLLLPPCPSWLHRYLWLALWPGCRRAVSEEAKTHTHHFPRYLRQLFQLPNTEHALCSSCLIRPLPKLNWFLLDSTHYVSFY